ncbi:NAD(P)/FAD-dependent oxidoreductase [Eubacteriales bacterium OttesenSCG-928-M02]|nr:NAD(P)/FAD-dependent oxidoreductase [Eubacteriales bacterium OttesenSCG-928-M02]
MYDVVIIGGGIIGCAVFRELTRYVGNVLLVEGKSDVCEGTSKANSAIIHAGFDAVPGSQKAYYNQRGSALYPRLCQELSIPFLNNGSLVVAGEEGAPRLAALEKNAQRNRIPGVTILSAAELYAKEPNLAPWYAYALYAPTGGIICPFEATYALYENGLANGGQVRLGCTITGIETMDGEGFCLKSTAGEIETKTVVNAAGLYADRICGMAKGDPFFIIPRRGEYCLLDKSEGDVVTHTIFRLPTHMGKGVLVTPTVHGNLLAGPTAEDIADKENLATTRKGMAYVLESAKDILAGGVKEHKIITSFCGLRAHGIGEDFIVGRDSRVSGLYHAACMESPGLSAAPAVGQSIAQMVAADLDLAEKKDFMPHRKRQKPFAEMDGAERAAAIEADGGHARIICRCETVTEGEIRNAIGRGARTLDGIKRRCRPGMGRCQGGFCTPRILEIMEEELGVSSFNVMKKGTDAPLVRYPLKGVPQ